MADYIRTPSKTQGFHLPPRFTLLFEKVVKQVIPPTFALHQENGGGGEIRTHGRVAPTTIFKTVAFNRSATPPGPIIITETKKNIHWC
jgi:hypothetical protein